MAIVDIHFDCGCGFHAKTVEEAIRHADEHKHILSVAGNVKSSEHKVRIAKASSSARADSRPRTVKPAYVAAPLQVQAEDKVDFNNLREKLQRK